MYETTVVGWDGSATAENAIAWAIGRASAHPVGARALHILRAVDDSGIAGDEEEAKRDVESATAEIEDLATLIRSEHRDLVVTTEVVRGEPGDVLADRAGPDALVVVGGENGHTEEYWYSSRMGARVSGAAAGPVAVVPMGDDHVRSGVMVAVGDSQESTALCRFAAELAVARGEALHAVHVGTRTHDIATDQEVLDHIVAPVIAEFPDLDVESHLESGTPAGALLRRARERSVVVVGSRQLGPVRRLFLGSVSHALVTNARCTTIVVPPQVHGAHR